MTTRTRLVTGAAGIAACTALMAALAGCVTAPATQSGPYRGRPPAPPPTGVVYQDDYDYYPGYEIYYARNRREFMYRDGNRWVRAPQPRGVSVNVLLASPSVRLDFHDEPERHHDVVVRSYPRNWSPAPVEVAYQDDYDYYPGHEVYYSRNRHEYIYRDGNAWVRRPQPRGISESELRRTPSVRVDFHDAPEQHHGTVVQTYPRNWTPPGQRRDNREDRRDDRRDDNDDRKGNGRKD